MNCGAETLPRYEERSAASSYLPEAFADDPDRLARFQREAQVLASLNHPNIAQIHGLEDSEGTRALVLELVEGPTLEDRIKQGPIPIDEALPIAKQIAEALEAAHEAGVIHRDLKPANIKVREDGTVKVLDFGLAKALDTTPEGDPSQSPTLTAAATQMGVIMGTAAYMSPEQAAGKPVDKRGDIWSFSVVLFEMLTGQRLFTGETVSHVLAKVLDRELDFSALPTPTPAPIRRLLRRCLERKPKRRLTDIGEALSYLEESAGAPAQEPSGRPLAPVVQPTGWRQAWPLAVAASVVVGLLTGLAMWSLGNAGSAEPQAVTRATITLPSSQQLEQAPGHVLVLSPDASTLVYIGISEGEQQLYRRPLNQLDPVAIPGTQDASEPFFSPDGEWVAFRSGLAMKKVALRGGPAVTLCECPYRGATWTDNDTIVFGGPNSGLMEVSAGGGEPRSLAELQEGEVEHRLPEVLPGGRAVLFTVVTAEGSHVAVQALDTVERRTLADGTDPHLLSTGHLVFGRGGSLWSAPFDRNRLDLTSEPVPILDGVAMRATAGVQAAFAGNGLLVYVRGAATELFERTVVWVDRMGNEETLPLPLGAYTNPRLSPDGTRLAVSVGPGQQALWVYDTRTGRGLRLTHEANAVLPVWTPDSQHVIFTWDIDGDYDLHWVPADGSGEIEQLTNSEFIDGATSVTPDGRAIIFSRVYIVTQHSEIFALPLDGERTPTPLLQGEFNRGSTEVSPNGDWISYRSDESGEDQIYLQPYPDLGRIVPVSIGGGRGVIWSADGSELFYRDGTAVMVIDVSTEGGTVSLGAPRELFDGNYRARSTREYHVGPDGRFLMLKDSSEGDGENPTQIVLVQNWFEELTRLVPVP